MNRNIRSTREIITIYNSLIKLAASNLGKKVKTDWGIWIPTMKAVRTMSRRVEKLSKGV